jgi:hypothetical protein
LRRIEPINAADWNKKSGGSGVDRNGGAKPRSEDYGAWGSSVKKCSSFRGMNYWGANMLPLLLIIYCDIGFILY